MLQRLKEFDEDIIVIMVTAQGGLETAVNTMRHGAYDYINKPFNLDEMAIVIRKALETSDLRREVVQLRASTRSTGPPKILGNSKHMKNVAGDDGEGRQERRLHGAGAGESGTGKELVAKCDPLPSRPAPTSRSSPSTAPRSRPTLLESELFGHEKGAFTDAKTSKKGLFELADGGTVFLDEIGDMELGMQAKLLRFLEDRPSAGSAAPRSIPVDVRIISATNKDLLKAIEEKIFRNDLYYRLQVIPIFLPPLRERREDIIAPGEPLHRDLHQGVQQAASRGSPAWRRSSWSSTTGRGTSAS